MKTILVPFKTASLVAASMLALAATARANFDWENLEGDIPGVAEITDQKIGRASCRERVLRLV